MKRLLRTYAIYAGSLCLCLCSSVISGKAIHAAPLQPHASSAAAPPVETVTIPGPLRSFMRMAAISQKVPNDEVLPLLARNIFMQGYQRNTPTEYLRLVDRYVQQARELQILAGPSETLRITNCDDAGTLVQILGYRLREACGQKNFFLETANPERAFLTIDSGFPLTDLEEALQKGVPFTYAYPASRVPVLFHESDWIALSAGQKKGYTSLVDLLINDPFVARLYWALTKNDAETRTALVSSPGLRRLLPYAATLDFYGSQISIRNNRVIVPGGSWTQVSWKDLAGASPENPGEFVAHLLAKDNGWLAVYFDVLSRVSDSQREHLLENGRLKRFYDDLRGTDLLPPPTRGVFRQAPELLVLFTRLEWEPNGQPHVPGNLETWRDILHQKTDSKTIHEWNKRYRDLETPEQLLDAMVAFSRVITDTGPLQIYLTMCEIDHGRTPEKRLSPEAVSLLAGQFSQFNNWYLVFAEFPDLSGESATRFVSVAGSIDKISNESLRGNTLGAFQANIGLWQILARQGEIPSAALNDSWQKMMDPFVKISSSTQLFDATRKSLGELLAASGQPNASPGAIVDLLAGPRQDTPDGQRVHQELARRIRAVLEDQHLVSLDTLSSLSDGFADMEQGKPAGDGMLALAGELREFEMPRPIFTQSEKIDWAPRVYTTHHAELQVQTDLTKIIKAPATKAQLEAARGQLAPFLRDTLVGLNYAYYEPPGAQILHNNPLFVRSHDFTEISVIGTEQFWQTPMLLGVGSPAGGGAYLMGSLTDLSYALATTEQDFIAPENVQALIWKELVPDLLVSATLPRWWYITPGELHAVALYQRSGEEILTASVKNPAMRAKAVEILSSRMTPQRLERVQQSLQRESDLTVMMPRLMPVETFYLAAEFHNKYPAEAASAGSASQQLQTLSASNPAEADPARISKDFGVPHPTLARTNGRELLNVKPFPFFGGYSSRLFGESWESNNLYWARLADEMGYSPVMLNRLVPELTRRMTAKIFATDLEDWPAMLRAMHEAGDELRQGKITSLPAAGTTALRQEQAVREASLQQEN
ncbi:MAG: hypothetical protein WDN23_06525 [Edaphobacter sp.]